MAHSVHTDAGKVKFIFAVTTISVFKCFTP